MKERIYRRSLDLAGLKAQLIDFSKEAWYLHEAKQGTALNSTDRASVRFTSF